MAVTDPHFYQRIIDLSSCLCGKIAENELPAPCFCGPISGDLVPFDYCQSTDQGNGMAWVRVVSISEQEMAIPGSGSQMSLSTCGTPLIANIEVGIVRCATTLIGSGGELPTAATYLSSVELQMADMNAALQAIRCCFSKKDTRIESWVPMGPGGGCVGGAWLAQVFEAM